MAVYPIKMLKDEGNNPFVPLVGTNAIVDAQGQSLDDKFATKLEAVNIIAGENITLQKVGNNITINGHAGSSVSLIDNLTTTAPGLGALDARQGKALKDLIPAVINNLNSTSTTSALSAYQGYLLKNRVVPAGGTTGQVLKKSSNADNAVEWGDNITVENNLTSTSTTNALSAAQGKILNDNANLLSNILTKGLGLEYKTYLGATWLKIYYTNSQNGTVVWKDKDELESSFKTNKWSIMGSLPFLYNSAFGGYEFLLEYPEFSKYNRWRQTSNPLYNSSVSGYVGVDINMTANGWGGMAISSSTSDTILDCSPNVGTWYYSIGQLNAYNDGIPADADPYVAQQVYVWIRIG